MTDYLLDLFFIRLPNAVAIGGGVWALAELYFHE